MPTQHEPPVLICHQRDQRRDDHGQSIGGDPRQLIAKALAAAGGHHHQTVAAIQRGDNGLTLSRPKVQLSQNASAAHPGHGPVVSALRRSVHVDTVQTAERELSGDIVIAERWAWRNPRLGLG